MIKSKQDKLQSKFNQICQQLFSNQPPAHLVSMLSKSSLKLNCSNILESDLHYIQPLLSLKFSSIILQANNEPILNKLFPFVIKSIRHDDGSLNSININNCIILNQYSREFSNALGRCSNLKEIIINNSALEDHFIRQMLYCLRTSNNIKGLYLSNNNIYNLDALVEVLSQHNSYRNEKVHMSKDLSRQEIAKQGIFEIDLSHNKITSNGISKLVQYLKEDKWLKRIDLTHNYIQNDKVHQFIEVLNENTSLVNLDLRNNPGYTTDLSGVIFKKLVKNLNQQKKILALKIDNNSADFGEKKIAPKNMTLNQIQQQNISCQNCKKLCTRLFKTEQKVFNLQLQNNKFKKIMQNRGFQISMITPSAQHNTEQISFSAKNMGPGDSSFDLIQKIQNMMAELTKILQAHELQQQTQTDITNPLLSTTHNLSNTVQILANNHNSMVVPLPQQDDDELSEIQ